MEQLTQLQIETMREWARKSIESARREADISSVERRLDNFFRCLSRLEQTPENFGSSRTEIKTLHRKGLLAEAKKILGILQETQQQKSVRQEIEAFLEYLRRKNIKPEEFSAKEKLQTWLRESCLVEVNEILLYASKLSDKRIVELRHALVATYHFIQKYDLKQEDIKFGPDRITELCHKTTLAILSNFRRSHKVADLEDVEILINFGKIPYKILNLSKFRLKLVKKVFKIIEHFQSKSPFDWVTEAYFSFYYPIYDKKLMKIMNKFDSNSAPENYCERMYRIYLDHIEQ